MERIIIYVNSCDREGRSARKLSFVKETVVLPASAVAVRHWWLRGAEWPPDTSEARVNFVLLGRRWHPHHWLLTPTAGKPPSALAKSIHHCRARDRSLTHSLELLARGVLDGIKTNRVTRQIFFWGNKLVNYKKKRCKIKKILYPHLSFIPLLLKVISSSLVTCNATLIPKVNRWYSFLEGVRKLIWKRYDSVQNIMKKNRTKILTDKEDNMINGENKPWWD